MNLLSEKNIVSAVYAFLIMGGLIAFLGSLMVYFMKKGKEKNVRRK